MAYCIYNLVCIGFRVYMRKFKCLSLRFVACFDFGMQICFNLYIVGLVPRPWVFQPSLRVLRAETRLTVYRPLQVTRRDGLPLGE